MTKRKMIFKLLEGIFLSIFGVYVGYGFIWDMSIFNRTVYIMIGIYFMLYGIMTFIILILTVIDESLKRKLDNEIKKFKNEV